MHPKILERRFNVKRRAFEPGVERFTRVKKDLLADQSERSDASSKIKAVRNTPKLPPEV